MANEQTNVMTSAGFRAYAADILRKLYATIQEAVERAKGTVAMLFVGNDANSIAIYNAFLADPSAESVTVEVDETCPAAVYDEQQQKYFVTVYRWQTVLGGSDMGGAQS